MVSGWKFFLWPSKLTTLQNKPFSEALRSSRSSLLQLLLHCCSSSSLPQLLACLPHPTLIPPNPHLQFVHLRLLTSGLELLLRNRQRVELLSQTSYIFNLAFFPLNGIFATLFSEEVQRDQLPTSSSPSTFSSISSPPPFPPPSMLFLPLILSPSCIY